MLFSWLAEKYLERRRKQGYIQGRAEVYKQWSEWNDRRIEAKEAGESFGELPPSGSNSSGSG